MNGAVLSGWGYKTKQGQWVEAGASDCRQLPMSDTCRDLSGDTSGAVRKARYWVLKITCKEMVDGLRRSGMGFASIEQ